MGQCVSGEDKGRQYSVSELHGKAKAKRVAKERRTKALFRTLRKKVSTRHEERAVTERPTYWFSRHSKYIDLRVDRTRKFRAFALVCRLRVEVRHTGPPALTSARTRRGSGASGSTALSQSMGATPSSQGLSVDQRPSVCALTPNTSATEATETNSDDDNEQGCDACSPARCLDFDDAGSPFFCSCMSF